VYIANVMSKRDSKIKMAVLTLSKCFMAGHSNAGKQTGFAEKLESGEKRHTIRANYKWWARKAEQINAGKMVLCIRQWSGRPYFSQQVELKRLERVRLQHIVIRHEWNADRISMHEVVYIDGRKLSLEEEMELAKNDGLTYEEWLEWMCQHNRDLADGVIIHFTESLEY